jgi:hypothetical protein
MGPATMPNKTGSPGKLLGCSEVLFARHGIQINLRR